MKKGTISIITGLLLITAALLLIGYNLWDDYRAGSAVQDVLEQLIPEIEDDPVPKQGSMRYWYIEKQQLAENAVEYPDYIEDEIEYPDYVLDARVPMPTSTIDGIDYVASISIPTLNLELPIISEWSYPHLKVAPCRYYGSAYLDNLVLCAHNYDRHFGRIKNLHIGDLIILTDMDGNRFAYSVIEIETLTPLDVDELLSGDWDLTLFTCTIGGRTRVTVRCERCYDNDLIYTEQEIIG